MCASRKIIYKCLKEKSAGDVECGDDVVGLLERDGRRLDMSVKKEAKLSARDTCSIER